MIVESLNIKVVSFLVLLFSKIIFWE